MIIYNPLDGHTINYSIRSKSKHCFLMTRLGKPVPKMVTDIRTSVEKCCKPFKYKVIDAQSEVTGRDFLLKIWMLISSTPLSVGIVHESIPQETQANIFYELGVAQALGKETVVIKSPKSKIPSDFVRSEYITFDGDFAKNFTAYLKQVYNQADYYEIMADQLEKNPILALDYLKRAFLITGNNKIKRKAKAVVDEAGLENRASNSVELIAANF